MAVSASWPVRSEEEREPDGRVVGASGAGLRSQAAHWTGYWGSGAKQRAGRKHKGMLLNYNKMIVSCSQQGVQSGQDSEKEAGVGVLPWAPVPWRVQEALGPFCRCRGTVTKLFLQQTCSSVGS